MILQSQDQRFLDEEQALLKAEGNHNNRTKPERIRAWFGGPETQDLILRARLSRRDTDCNIFCVYCVIRSDDHESANQSAENDPFKLALVQTEFEGAVDRRLLSRV